MKPATTPPKKPQPAPRDERDHPSWNRSRGFAPIAGGGRKRHMRAV